MKRTELKRKTRLRTISPKRRGTAALHALIREAVFRRDGYRCVLAGVAEAGRCFGVLTPHHVLKASAGGEYVADNLVTMCAHHNDQLEADADLARLARELGYVKRREDRSGSADG